MVCGKFGEDKEQSVLCVEDAAMILAALMAGTQINKREAKMIIASGSLRACSYHLSFISSAMMAFLKIDDSFDLSSTPMHKLAEACMWYKAMMTCQYGKREGNVLIPQFKVAIITFLNTHYDADSLNSQGSSESPSLQTPPSISFVSPDNSPQKLKLLTMNTEATQLLFHQKTAALTAQFFRTAKHVPTDATLSCFHDIVTHLNPLAQLPPLQELRLALGTREDCPPYIRAIRKRKGSSGEYYQEDGFASEKAFGEERPEYEPENNTRNPPIEEPNEKQVENSVNEPAGVLEQQVKQEKPDYPATPETVSEPAAHPRLEKPVIYTLPNGKKVIKATFSTSIFARRGLGNLVTYRFKTRVVDPAAAEAHAKDDAPVKDPLIQRVDYKPRDRTAEQIEERKPEFLDFGGAPKRVYYKPLDRTAEQIKERKPEFLDFGGAPKNGVL